MQTRSGMSMVQGVVSLVVVVAVIGAVMFFLSDPFRTKTKAAYRSFAEWTPENIAKDPLNYLNFCEEQTQAAILKLKAGEIAIGQKQGQVSAMLAENKNKVELGEKALTELKAAFRAAETGSKWPIAWRGMSLDQDQAKRQILKFAGEVKSKGELIRKLEAAVAQLKAQTGKVQETRDRANEQLSQIAASREMLKVQQITDDLKNNLVAMKTVIQSSVLGAVAAEPGTISLDDLAASSEASVDETEFSKIMAQ